MKQQRRIPPLRQRFSRNLRSMLLEWLIYESSTEAFYLNDLLYELEGLFELLEAVEEEMERKWRGNGEGIE